MYRVCVVFVFIVSCVVRLVSCELCIGLVIVYCWLCIVHGVWFIVYCVVLLDDMLL